MLMEYNKLQGLPEAQPSYSDQIQILLIHIDPMFPFPYSTEQYGSKSDTSAYAALQFGVLPSILSLTVKETLTQTPNK
jgi:hypothetical protein